MKKLLVAGLLLCVFTLGTYAQEKKKKEKLQRSLIGQRFPDFNVQEWIGRNEIKRKVRTCRFWCIMAYLSHTVPCLIKIVWLKNIKKPSNCRIDP